MRIDSVNEKTILLCACVGVYDSLCRLVCEKCIREGINTLYFISRDGHFLKEIADAYINMHQLSIKTKYFYGSRRAWRIPAMIDNIDDEFSLILEI